MRTRRRLPRIGWLLGAAWLACLGVVGGCDETFMVATLGELAAVPDPVVFPETPVSTLRTQDVLLANHGTAAVALVSLEVTENTADFSMVLPPELVLPTTIAPGNQVAFAVRYHPQLYPEEDVGTLHISSGDRDAPEYDLRLQGTAVEPVLLVQPMPVLFPDTRVLATSPVTLSITHTGSDPAPVQLSFLDLTDDGEGDFSVQDPPALPTTLDAGGVLRVHLAYTPQAIDDGDGGTLTLESDAESQEHLEIPLSGASFAPHIVVSTTALNFGTVSQGADPSLPITIENTGNEDLHVTGLELSATGSQKFSFAPAALADPIPPGGQAQVLVTYLADDRGDDDGVLRILHDDPLERPVFVQLHGRTPCPDVEVEPDFATIQISGTSTTQAIDIRVFNLGDEDLLLTGMDFNNPDGSFSIDAQPSFPVTVEPGVQPTGPFATLTVRFTKDTATVDDECQLTLATDDPDEPTVVVRVVGSYTPP